MNEPERPTPNSARAVRTYSISPERLLSAFRRAVGRLPRWTVNPSAENEVSAVRTTRLLRFKDDVTVRVYAEGGATRAELTSASRTGKSDLGQNPRNLEELLQAADRETLDEADPSQA